MNDHMMGHRLFYPWEYLGIYFTVNSAIEIHLSLFFLYFLQCQTK